MGEVFRALDVETGERVAVKRLRFKGTDSDRVNRARFRKEITLALTLEHPHIVRALDGGEDDQGLFLVLEYLDGVELDDHLRAASRLEWERAVGLLAGLCSALDYVHARSILHRDVKADNAMLLRAGQPDERLVLIDFGIARAVDQPTQLTSSGMLVGTAMYCAPEQIAGLLVDQRADLYALGVVLFRMLTGVFPFEGPELPRVIYGHLHTPPPSVRLFAPAAPEALEALVQRCLAKDPTARFESAGALEVALRRLLDVPSGPLEVLANEARATPALAPEEMLEFVEHERTFGKTEATPFTDEQPVVAAPPRAGGLLLALQKEAALELRAVTMLSWATRLSPFFDPHDATLRRLERLLERVLGELFERRGQSAFSVVGEHVELNGQRLVAPLGNDDLGAALARTWRRHGLEGLVLLRAPTRADVALLVQLMRTGDRSGLDTLSSMRVAFQVAHEAAGRRARSPGQTWRDVTAGIGLLIDAAARGRPFDGLEALRLTDLVVVEAQRRGRRLLGVAGAFEGTANLAAQAANTAFTAAALAVDFGLPAARVRDVAHLAISSAVGMIQVYPLAFVAPEQLSEDERSLLRQTPVSVIRSVLAEASFGPAVWRRMVMGYELASELSRGVEASLGRGALVPMAPSLPTRLVFVAMTWWGLRSPLPDLPASAPEEISRLMRGVLRLRLDDVAVMGLERALADVEEHPVADLSPGAEVALVGSTPAPGALKKLTEPSDRALEHLAELLQSLVSTGLEPRSRILALLLPVMDSLLLQDELGLLNGFIRRLKVLGGDGGDSLEVNLARDLVHHLVDDECVALLAEVLRDGPPKDAKELSRLLTLVGAEEVPSLARLLDVVHHEASRAAVLEAFAAVARQHAQTLAELANEAPEARAVDLIEALSRAKAREAMSLVKARWAQAAPKARARLLEACTRFASAEGVAFLAGVAQSAEATLGQAALQALARSAAVEASAALVALARHPAVDRGALFEALALRGDGPCMQVLAAIVAEKPPLLQRSRFTDERLALVRALERAGGLSVLPLLSTLAADARQAPEVRRAGEAAVGVVKQALSRPGP